MTFDSDFIDLIRRALALRKAGRIGVLWCEDGRVWISENEVDPYGSRLRVSLEALRALVEELESKPEKRPPGRVGEPAKGKTATA
jgi:hypothetical protein